MRLLVVSHTPHYRRGSEIVGWGPTVREIDALSELFTKLVHLAPLHPEPAPASALPYRSPRVSLRALTPMGGDAWSDKATILTRTPGTLRALSAELRAADAVHVRAPAGVSLLALALLATRLRPAARWIKYAGNWRPQSGEPPTYAFQRWWLQRRRLHRGIVTVNGVWNDQRPHVRSFDNPCLTREELAAARPAAEEKRISTPLRLLYAGALAPGKGVDTTIEIAARVGERGVPCVLDVVGDGPERDACERLAAGLADNMGSAGAIRFHGALPRPRLEPFYAAAHVLLLPSRSEGWPKVLSEAMAHGVVPLAGAVSGIPRTLAECATGRAFTPGDVDSFADAAVGYYQDPERWRSESRAALDAAGRFTYERYLDAVRVLFTDTWGVAWRR